MSELKAFQQATVDYVLDRFYGDTPTKRFLVADEVGMGKTLVARGVIAGAIERLQHSNVPRIDVLYICSNAEIARQNLARITPKGYATKPLNTRITLLATQMKDLDAPTADGSKTVNFISFTPGTSFQRGRRGGRVQERALLARLVESHFRGEARRRAVRRLLQLNVSSTRWKTELGQVATYDARIARKFRGAFRGSELAARMTQMVSRYAGRPGTMSEPEQRKARALVGDLRALLAKVSVRFLEPDLVILDEFQRFKDLLDPPDEDAHESVSQLAHQLFNEPDAKVLLLSATPYRGFTFAEERSLTGDDHHADFIRTVEFLSGSSGVATRVRALLAEFRSGIELGADIDNILRRLREELLQVMCRTERPVLDGSDMLDERAPEVPAPTASDVRSFVALDRIAKELDAPMSVEYWKSSPYFLNFMDGYKFGDRAARKTPEAVRKHADGAQMLSKAAVATGTPIEPGNARLRALQAQTVAKGWWRLLWLPPSLPYYEPGPVYREFERSSVSKRLIFSSWAAAPTAIASLLSYEADRSVVEGRSIPPARLQHRIDANGRAGAMTTFALFTPLPRLAERTDPLAIARRVPDRRLTPEEVQATAEDALPPMPRAGEAASDRSADSWYWAAPLLVGLDSPDQLESLPTTLGLTDRGLALHIDRARGVFDDERLGSQPDDLRRWTALFGLASPANVAWRSLRRITADIEGISEEALFDSAAIVAEGFRSLFNRGETMLLLGDGDGDAYWQSVLKYCLDGNLQSMLDEYFHHLFECENVGAQSGLSVDEQVLAIAREVQGVIALRVATFHAVDPLAADGKQTIDFGTRFALRYGSARGEVTTDEGAQERLKAVKGAFNSPFWPFVLASTSVGQEGIDFHWWCHSIVHWNVPSNPVDFEQREGRVHRYKGLAIRRNVAAAHRPAALTSTGDPWHAMFAAAEQTRPEGVGELWPWWVHPGPAKIERWIPAMPLSRDYAKREEMTRLRALYRLCFGQPRQEDLLELLRRSGVDEELADRWRLDLRPPRTS